MGFTSHPIHIGGTKVALPFANYIVCDFHATYMDSMTGNPALKNIKIDKWDLKMKAYARFEESLTMGYFLI